MRIVMIDFEFEAEIRNKFFKIQFSIKIFYSILLFWYFHGIKHLTSRLDGTIFTVLNNTNLFIFPSLLACSLAIYVCISKPFNIRRQWIKESARERVNCVVLRWFQLQGICISSINIKYTFLFFYFYGLEVDYFIYIL